MFPTTVWTTIRSAGSDDPEALDRFAREYRAAVLAYIRGRGFAGNDAEDLCQDVFVRLLSGRVLAKADSDRGRFRSLLLMVVRRTIQDRLRRRRPEVPLPDVDPADRDPDFDRAWVLNLTERALAKLKRSRSPYYAVLQGHLAGEAQNRNKLWIARGKLIGLIRNEVALTCNSPEEFREEVAYLSSFLRPASKK